MGRGLVVELFAVVSDLTFCIVKRPLFRVRSIAGLLNQALTQRGTEAILKEDANESSPIAAHSFENRRE